MHQKSKMFILICACLAFSFSLIATETINIQTFSEGSIFVILNALLPAWYWTRKKETEIELFEEIRTETTTRKYKFIRNKQNR